MKTITQWFKKITGITKLEKDLAWAEQNRASWRFAYETMYAEYQRDCKN